MFAEHSKPNRTIDARGLPCPRPIHLTQEAIQNMKPGEILEILVSDRGTQKDLQLWCLETGHEFAGSSAQEGYETIFIRRR